MKSFAAIALALVPKMVAAGLRRPIHLALSHDEETGCHGAPALIAELTRRVPTPAAVIVGEPTAMRVVGAHKGIGAYRTTVTGREAHSSQPHRGASAVMAAADLVHWLGREAAARAAAPIAGSLFDPPYTTMTCGQIEGGTALNILAGACRFVWDIRAVPGEDVAAVLAAFAERSAALESDMQGRAPEARISTETLADVPAFCYEPETEAERLVRSLTGDNSLGGVSFAAEAGLFQQAGLSTIMCGPGSIDQAHQPDEFITLDQVRAGTVFLRRLIAHLSA
jgi:acetylornithine deacetylase